MMTVHELVLMLEGAVALQTSTIDCRIRAGGRREWPRPCAVLRNECHRNPCALGSVCRDGEAEVLQSLVCSSQQAGQALWLM